LRRDRPLLPVPADLPGGQEFPFAGETPQAVTAVRADKYAPVVADVELPGHAVWSGRPLASQDGLYFCIFEVAGCPLRGPHATRTVEGRASRSMGERGDGSRRENFHMELAPRTGDFRPSLLCGGLQDHLALRTGEVDHGKTLRYYGSSTRRRY